MKFDEKEAYMAMFYFLENLYELTKSDDLGGFLGSMTILEDGMPADSAYWQDWLEAVEKVRHKEMRVNGK